MRKLLIILVVFTISQVSNGQVAGNSNYHSNYLEASKFSDKNINLVIPSDATVAVSVKGLANLKADTYVAIFSLTQAGKTTEEVNTLIDNRISQALANLKAKQGVETFVDMISFVPVYEYETGKKLFSKKTYNEIPVGFEIKKNIHVKYRDPDVLNQIITIFSSSEIYDLVRVDYFSDKIEAIKTELANKAKALLQEKIKNYTQVLGTKIDSNEKKMVDGYKVIYPAEMYNSYQAYSNSTLYAKKSETVNEATKSTTLYYQPIIDKEFDFVINTTILEPVIQVMYQVKLEINQEKSTKDVPKDYFLITPSGDLKKLELRK